METVCDDCQKTDDFVVFEKRRITYISCECGNEWEKGTNKTESKCPNCGNYQHPLAGREFTRGNKECWFCFHKHGETEAKFKARKKRGH